MTEPTRDFSSQKKPRSGKRRWLTHPLTLALTPVVIGASLTAFFVYLQNHPALPVPRIEIDSMTVRSSEPFRPFGINFQLRNTGSQLAVITAVDLHVEEFLKLPICGSQGYLPVSHHYPANMPLSTAPGKVVRIPISEQVGPDAADRFEISLRLPPSRSVQMNAAIRLYRVRVGLIYDNLATPVEAGVVIVSLPLEPNIQYAWTRSLQKRHGSQLYFYAAEFQRLNRCMVANSKKLAALLSLPGQEGAGLSSFRSQIATCCVELPVVKVVRCPQQIPTTRPASMIIGCDGTGELESMRWARWGFTSAEGMGSVRLDDCKPSCAVGKFHTYSVQVVFSDPVNVYEKHYSGLVWNKAVITFAGGVPAGMGRVTTFDNFAPLA
jgi:hypothetical protein